jgi:hypothetical protein
MSLAPSARLRFMSSLSSEVGAALSAFPIVDPVSLVVLIVERREEAKLLVGSCCRASTLKANVVNKSRVFRHLDSMSSLALLMYAMEVAGEGGGGSMPTAADILYG